MSPGHLTGRQYLVSVNPGKIKRGIEIGMDGTTRENQKKRGEPLF
jgi:hypothetical protein